MSHRSLPSFAALLGVAVLLGLAACDADSGTPGASHPVSLAGTSWSVVSVNGRTPVPHAVPTAVFTATEVSGESGCNHYGGHYRYDGGTGRIAFDQLRMTAMACAEEARNTFETLFTQALAVAVQVSLDPTGRLVVEGPSTQIVLVPDLQGAVEP